MAEGLLRVVGAPPLQVAAWAPSFPVPVRDNRSRAAEGGTDGLSDPLGPGTDWPGLGAGPPGLGAGPPGLGPGPPGLGAGPSAQTTGSSGLGAGPLGQNTGPTPLDPWPLPPSIAQSPPRPGPPGGLIALLQAAPTQPESLVTALITESGSQLIAVSLSPAPPPIFSVPVDEPRLTAGLIAERLAFLTERADLVLLDLGCRWAPALFRPILTTADEIWLIGPTGAWPAFEARLAQAEFSGWTDLKRLHLVALGPVGPEPAPHLHSEPIQVLENPAEITRFAQTCWRRRTR